ncbi:MAG: hypothetical protein IT423_16865 [Pirellulaceae bacterium]|nr:hypothetical protein [Pirellulaceae bacterium]
MPRLLFFRLLTIAGAVLFFSQAAQAQVADFDANQAEVAPGEIVNLEDQLLNGLRVVNSQQRAYVQQIVALVNQGKLPRAMVNVVYTYALKRNPRVPLPYFQYALHALAERRGVAVPLPQNFSVTQ